MSDDAMRDNRRLGDSFAIALLQWPAIIAVIELGDAGWGFALKIVLGIWAALVSLGMIMGRKEGPRWGLTMTLCAACAAVLWLSFPGVWALLWFVALMITFYAAVHTRMTEAAPLARNGAEPEG